MQGQIRFDTMRASLEFLSKALIINEQGIAFVKLKVSGQRVDTLRQFV